MRHRVVVVAIAVAILAGLVSFVSCPTGLAGSMTLGRKNIKLGQNNHKSKISGTGYVNNPPGVCNLNPMQYFYLLVCV